MYLFIFDQETVYIKIKKRVNVTIINRDFRKNIFKFESVTGRYWL